MTQPSARSRDPERTTADLLAAAEQEFADHGFAGARVDRIAASAGVNKGLIFQRFGDKLGLYRGVLTGLAERGVRHRDALLTSLSPTTREEFRATLVAFVDASLDFLASEPNAARILLWEEASGWETLGKPELGGDAQSEDCVQQLFALAGERGWLRPGLDPHVQLSLALQVPFTTAALAVDPTTPAVRRFMIDFIVSGLLAPETTSTAPEGNQ